MGGCGGVRSRAGLGLLALAFALVPIDGALGQQPPTTAPPITIPDRGDLVGGAQNTNDSVGATLTGLGGQGSGGGGNTGGSGSSGTGTQPSTGSSGGSSGGGSSGGGTRGGGSSGGGSSGGGSSEPPITNPVSCNSVDEFLNPAPGTTCGTNLPVLLPSNPAAPATPAGGAPVGGTPSSTVPPRSAVQIARDIAQRTAIPLPGIRTSPPDGNDQLVNLPTWLWVEDWTPRRATAAEGALTVTVVATPRSVTWRMGDGSSVVCGRGTPWDPALREEQQSTACSHTYLRSSATQPDLKYQARATMTWDVTWTATNGESGSLGQANRSVDFTMRVAESQAIVTWSGR